MGTEPSVMGTEPYELVILSEGSTKVTQNHLLVK
jgi:hypothetical protein